MGKSASKSLADVSATKFAREASLNGLGDARAVDETRDFMRY
jgi:hypothetical protein